MKSSYSTFSTSSTKSTNLSDLFEAPLSMSPSSSGFKDYDQVQWDAFAGVPFNLPGEQRHQILIPFNTDQSNIEPYGRNDFEKVLASPVTTKNIVGCRTTHIDDTTSCNVDHVKQEREFKKAKRREQNRAAQRNFRARKDEHLKKVKEQCFELTEKCQNLRSLYDQQVEKTMFLEAKLRDLAEEVTTPGLCSKCSWDILGDTCFRDIDLRMLHVSI